MLASWLNSPQEACILIVHVCLYVCMPACQRLFLSPASVCVCVCVCVCVVCLCVCVCVCVCVVCVCVYVRACGVCLCVCVVCVCVCVWCVCVCVCAPCDRPICRPNGRAEHLTRFRISRRMASLPHAAEEACRPV
jgi:hypothetical protein